MSRKSKRCRAAKRAGITGCKCPCAKTVENHLRAARGTAVIFCPVCGAGPTVIRRKRPWQARASRVEPRE